MIIVVEPLFKVLLSFFWTWTCIFILWVWTRCVF